MMIQTLVENAIKHGLEPKAEGGTLRVAAEIVHGKLQVTVADTGLGFGKAATAGTGVGLANIRERLQLLYGRKATLTVAENQPSGTVVTDHRALQDAWKAPWHDRRRHPRLRERPNAGVDATGPAPRRSLWPWVLLAAVRADAAAGRVGRVAGCWRWPTAPARASTSPIDGERWATASTWTQQHWRPGLRRRGCWP